MNKRQFDNRFFAEIGKIADRREKNDAQIKHEEKIFGHDKSNLKNKTATKDEIKDAVKEGEVGGPPHRILP